MNKQNIEQIKKMLLETPAGEGDYFKLSTTKRALILQILESSKDDEGGVK